MKVFISSPGDSIQQNFLVAWETCLHENEPVTFLHNEIRVLVLPDPKGESFGLPVEPFPEVKERAILIPEGYKIHVWKPRKKKASLSQDKSIEGTKE